MATPRPEELISILAIPGTFDPEALHIPEPAQRLTQAKERFDKAEARLTKASKVLDGTFVKPALAPASGKEEVLIDLDADADADDDDDEYLLVMKDGEVLKPSKVSKRKGKASGRPEKASGAATEALQGLEKALDLPEEGLMRQQERRLQQALGRLQVAVRGRTEALEIGKAKGSGWWFW